MYIKQVSTFLLLFWAAVNSGNAQARPEEPVDPEPGHMQRATIGLGVGQDFGFLGLNSTYYVTTRVGIFGSFGGTMIGVGYNAGIKYQLLPFSTGIRPYLLGMYGYHTIFTVVNMSDELDKTFYGVSLGGGVDFYQFSERNFWSVGFAVPMRGQKVSDYKQMLEDDYGVAVGTLLPFTLSVGYHIKIN